jgi:hypothetical protein
VEFVKAAAGVEKLLVTKVFVVLKIPFPLGIFIAFYNNTCQNNSTLLQQLKFSGFYQRFRNVGASLHRNGSGG